MQQVIFSCQLLMGFLSSHCLCVVSTAAGHWLKPKPCAGEEDAAESDSDDSTTNISDLDDEEWDALWESGEETSSESGFDIDDGWAVEDVKLDSPPRMDRIGRFDKQLRNTSKARKLAIPLTGRVRPCLCCVHAHLQLHGSQPHPLGHLTAKPCYIVQPSDKIRLRTQAC